MTAPRGRTAVYRLYGRDRELLYVGISHRPYARFLWHRANKDWWPDVARHELDWRPTRQEALEEESRVIRSERPLHNGGGTATRTRRLSERGAAYTPPLALSERLAEWEEALAAAEEAKAALIAAVVDELHTGVLGATLAEHLPWNKETVRIIAREHGVKRKRQPTVSSYKDGALIDPAALK